MNAGYVFFGWLLGVAYGNLLGWRMLIFGMILGDILGDSWWLYG